MNPKYISATDSPNKELEAERERIKQETEAFLAASSENGIEVIEQDNEKVIEELGEKYRKLTHKTMKFNNIHIGST